VADECFEKLKLSRHSCSCEPFGAGVPIMMDETNIHVIQLNEWIAKQGSGVLQGMAVNWNWDNGAWMLKFIIRNPLCSKATAQYVFLTAEPGYKLASGYIDNDILELVEELLGRWHENKFVDGIRSDPTLRLAEDHDEFRRLEKKHPGNKFLTPVPDSIFALCPGISSITRGTDVDLPQPWDKLFN
jgi:hypothetical protein